jgi:hypothetical protein
MYAKDLGLKVEVSVASYLRKCRSDTRRGSLAETVIEPENRLCLVDLHCFKCRGTVLFTVLITPFQILVYVVALHVRTAALESKAEKKC